MILLSIVAAIGLQTSQPEPPVLRGSWLYAVDPDTEERYPTARIPYRPGRMCFEWVVFTEPEKRALAVREEFHLPAPAPNWDVPPDGPTRVSADGTSAVTEFTDSLDDSQISNSWCIAEGDPLGPYRIRVFSGERLLDEVAFEVVADE